MYLFFIVFYFISFEHSCRPVLSETIISLLDRDPVTESDDLSYYFSKSESRSGDNQTNSEFDKLKPTFWLYTRETVGFEKELALRPNYYWNIDMIGFNERDTKILIHGWDTNRFSEFSQKLKETFLKEMDVNVIIVDWSKLAAESYHTATTNLTLAANFVGDFLKYLTQTEHVALSRIHLIGFGLGAHLAGLASKTLAPKKVFAITGLDPVSPLSTAPPKMRLAKTDAQYVEVIHTGARRFIGSPAPLGHADFYPNGGKLQPGCGLDLLATCSGDRALHLYSSSLETAEPVFKGTRCNSLLEAVQRRCHSSVRAVMGGRQIKKANGIYYLETKDRSPFY